MMPFNSTPIYGALPPGAVIYPPPGYAVQPAPPPVRTAQTPPPKPAVVRGQAPDSAVPPIRTAMAMPSPDQLGVSAKPAGGACDWAAVHKRLQELGVVSFDVDHPGADLYMFTCFLPTAEAGRTHRIEAHGATEAEAVQRALDEAKRWREQRQ